MIGDYLEIYTFEYLMNQALASVSDDIDKRQGSVIYDALAPACHRLAELYGNLRNVYKDTFAETAEGEMLDLRAAEHGLTRYAATFALKKAYFTDASNNPMAIPLGARFSTLSDISPIIYVVEANHTEDGNAVPGYYVLRCETPGSAGNEYSGPLTNITHIQGLASATMYDFITAARDEESDKEFRTRYFETVKTRAFAGNRADYKQRVRDIEGVGDVQVYPVWDGGGTVKLSIVDEMYNPCPDFVDDVKNEVDPVEAEGSGLGLAAIGHTVTVVTPMELPIAVTVNVQLSSNYTKGMVTAPIEEALTQYFATVRKEWAKEDDLGNYSLSIFRSRVIGSILNIPGISNVVSVLLNGAEADIPLTQTAQTQQLPKLGEVTVNA